jgi:hypothetical protein
MELPEASRSLLQIEECTNIIVVIVVKLITEDSGNP